MEVTTNTFDDGLNLDMNPLVAPSNTMSNCLNGTLITYNGNDLVLQNDMGNGRVETAHLPSGYVPVGMKEHAGVIYVASYNPLTQSSLIGCFPSPERNIEDTFNSALSILYPLFGDVYALAALIDEKIVPGNELLVKLTDRSSNPFARVTPNFSDAKGTPYNDLNDRYSIYITVMSSDGVLIDQTPTFTPIEHNSSGNYYWFYTGNNIDTDFANYSTIYQGMPGTPYIKVVENGIIEQDIAVDLQRDGKSDIIFSVDASYIFNCPVMDTQPKYNDGFAGVKVYAGFSESSMSPIGTCLFDSECTRIEDGFSISIKGSKVYTKQAESMKGRFSSGTLYYKTVPIFYYDGTYLDDNNFAVTRSVDISKISSGLSTLNAWKFFYEPNAITIAWGMESYPATKSQVPTNVKFRIIEAPYKGDVPDHSVVGELYNDELVYTNATASLNTGDKLTLGTRIDFSENVIIAELFPEDRSNYNGLFTEVFTNSISNLKTRLAYLVLIYYEIDGAPMVYYRWLFTTPLYNKYYYSEIDYSKINLSDHAELTNFDETIDIYGSVASKEYLDDKEFPKLLFEDNVSGELQEGALVRTYIYEITPTFKAGLPTLYPVSIQLTSQNIALTHKNKTTGLPEKWPYKDPNNPYTYVLLYEARTEFSYSYSSDLILINNLFRPYPEIVGSMKRPQIVLFPWAYPTNHDRDSGKSYYKVGCGLSNDVGFVYITSTLSDLVDEGKICDDDDNLIKEFPLTSSKLHTFEDELQRLNTPVVEVVVPVHFLAGSGDNLKLFAFTESNKSKNADDYQTYLAYNFLVYDGSSSFHFLNNQFLILKKHRITDEKGTKGTKIPSWLSRIDLESLTESDILTNTLFTTKDSYGEIIDKYKAFLVYPRTGDAVKLTLGPSSTVYSMDPNKIPLMYNPISEKGCFRNLILSCGQSSQSAMVPHIMNLTEDLRNGKDEQVTLETDLMKDNGNSLSELTSDILNVAITNEEYLYVDGNKLDACKSNLDDIDKSLYPFVNFTPLLKYGNIKGVKSPVIHTSPGLNDYLEQIENLVFDCGIVKDEKLQILDFPLNADGVYVEEEKNGVKTLKQTSLIRKKLNGIYHPFVTSAYSNIDTQFVMGSVTRDGGNDHSLAGYTSFGSIPALDSNALVANGELAPNP